MAESWTGSWRGLKLRVERREVGDDGGATLRIGPIDGALEWLRFDCFDENPHWHLDPSGRDEIHPLPDLADPVALAFGMLASEWPGLLLRAGAPGDLASALSQAYEDPEFQSLLREAECAMRHRPAVLDELDIRLLEQRRTAKWHQYPADILPAWVAEMDFPLAAPIQDELERLTRIGDAGYPLDIPDTGLREAFRDRMLERFGWNPDPSRIEVLSEVVQGMYIALEAFTEPGDSAIVQTPIYPPFLQAVDATGRRLIENPLVVRASRLDFDLDSLPARIEPNTRVLMLCNPHNPSGRVMERAVLEGLAHLVLEHDLIVISDEIHADLLFDGRVHIPFATLGPELAERTVTLTSASKAFNIPGLRCALAHFGSAELQQRFNQIHSPHVRGGIGLYGIYASIAAWRWAQPWLDEVVPYLQANRDYTRDALRERIPEIVFYPPESTYLAWLDCSALDLKGSPASHFRRHGRVALTDGRHFGADWRQHVRLNFATSRPILTELIDRMAKAIGR